MLEIGRTAISWLVKRRVTVVRLTAVAVMALAVNLVSFPEQQTQTFADDRPSLRDIRHQRDQDRRFNNEVEFTNQICGTNISASIRWDSFNSRGTGAYVVGSCDVALSAIESICRENPARVRGKIAHVECGTAKKRNALLQNGTLQYAVGYDTKRDDYDFVLKYLKKKL